MRHAEATTLDDGLVDARLRDCTRVLLDRPDIAEQVWRRIQPHIESEVHVDGSDEARQLGLPAGEPELHGTWRPYGVNPKIRVCKYPGDGRGHFGPHVDAAWHIDAHDQSLCTVNGYLNTIPEGAGGCTRFLVDELPIYKDERGRFTVEDSERSVLGAIRPEEIGMAAVFYHGKMHDSEPLAVGSPSKWIWRTEVMYRRDAGSRPRLC